MVWETRATWKNDPADTRQCSCLNVLHSHSCAFEMLKDACFVLYTQAFISEMLLRQQPKKKKKSLWKVEAINIISFEEPVSASLRECPMTVSEASGGEESVLKSSVEITTRKSCWSKHSEVWGCGGVWGGCECSAAWRRQREISTGGFASFAPSLSLKEVHTLQTRNAHTHRRDTSQQVQIFSSCCGPSLIYKLQAIFCFFPGEYQTFTDSESCAVGLLLQLWTEGHFNTWKCHGFPASWFTQELSADTRSFSGCFLALVARRKKKGEVNWTCSGCSPSPLL